MKIQATKMKMTQIWKGDLVVPVSPLKLVDAAKTEEFKEGELVKVTGVTKGRGFQGVVKRYSFAGGPKTHGQKNRYRAPGSIGATAPQRVIPGKKMGGHMGMQQYTIKNLKVVSINKEGGLVLVRGSVPGTIGRKLTIQKITA
ncbi:MAG: 50S ribosomal protein L3 [Candidatus Harrisonbacteria bacterium RIFCSPLOWO2_02_FULL_45_10c]|uniref:Large ribosomal subunit protein uL3 n=1 Tax=Candidatus Harrisonbacteria bacterium RIFCSPLOWO2_02_FULL_45_10c TaxID=1798410 RepID=A0A1G1ZX48_9BACT|nr:MAG: 50S ribosomal protein L3 [Candidatus Harrisonbacteria bacterium RIFCSPLOWO2_02_FULL_45_10c]